MPSLPVDLNGERLHDVSVPGSFETTGTFEVELRNRGEAVHVHLHLDDDLSRVARLREGNHYVAGGDALSVPIEVSRVDEPVTGRLKIVTAYGAETAHVTVTVAPSPKPSQIEVDESLSKPQRRESTESGGLPFDLPASPEVVAGAAIALILLVVVGVVVDRALLFLVVGIVVGGALVAVALAD